MTTSNLNLSLTISAIDQASSVISSVGNAIQQLASGNVVQGLMGIGQAIVQVGAQATQMAADYQQSMNMIQSLTGANTQQMAQYDSQLKQLSVDAGVAPTQLSQGLYNVMSAGYSGGDAMRVLALATEDAKIGMTDSATTTNALTNVMKSFGVQASDATRVNGEMLATVTAGKSTFSQYANSITTAASTSTQFHESMETMNAAWATLTSSGISAGQATTDYDQSLRIMDGNIGTVAKSLNKSGIAFSEAKFNTLDYGGKVQMLSQALDKAASEHVRVTGATQQGAQAIQTIAKNMSTYNNDLATFSNKAEMAKKTQDAWAITQQGFNQKMSQLNAAFSNMMIAIGNKLLPILGKLAGAITPLIVGFTNWINGSHQANGAMSQIGGFLSSVFMPMWNQLVQLWQTQIVPMWGQLQAAIRPLMPTFQGIAVVIGGSLYASFVVIITIIREVIGFFSGLLTGAVLVVKGIVMGWQGGIQYLSGLISFFVDLFTGKWNNLGTDLGNIAGGIVKMWQGMWTATEGVFVSAINSLIGIVNGFVQGMLSGINAVLTATGHAAISVGNISMVSAGAVSSGNYTNAFTPTASQAQGVTSAQQAQSNNGLMSMLDSLLKPQQQTQGLIQQANTESPATLNALNNLNDITVPQAANTVANATNNGSTKTAAQIAKAADTANAQSLKLAADQQKALTASDSPAVQALINQSKAAAAKGDTSTAAFYASQADTLANQQKAATVKAAKAAETAAHHKAVLAAAAERKAQASKNHAEIMAAKAAAAKAKAADKAAKAAVKAAQHKQLIDTIVNAANQVSGQTTNTSAVIAATAAGVILPDYAQGTAYTAYNAQPQAATTGNTTINVTVAANTNDPKAHGKAVADEVNKRLAKHLRSGSIAPRYTKGGTHK